MAPLPIPAVVTRQENIDKQMDILVPILAAGIPIFVGCVLVLIAAASYRSRRSRKCIEFLSCNQLGFGADLSTQGSQRVKKVVQSSPKAKRKITQMRYPIDISTITRTLPTIPEVMESYTIPFIPSLSSTQLSKYQTLYRTPSDVPRTAELIESDSGPGKTVTATDYSRSGRFSYQSGFHLISGITPIKDSTLCSTELISYGFSSGFIMNTDSNIQSSAGVNICILSPDVNISKNSMFILPKKPKLIRNLSSSFSTISAEIGHAIELSSRRINNTPVEPSYQNNTNSTTNNTSENFQKNYENFDKSDYSLQYREFFIPGISFPTIPTIYPLLRVSEHWV